MTKKIAKNIIILILLLAIIIIGSNMLFVVAEGNYVVVMRFSKAVDIKSEAGLYFKTPFIDSVYNLPKLRLFYDVNKAEVLTIDKKNMVVDNYVVWRIVEPYKFIRELSTVREAESRIEANVYSVVRTIMGTMEQSEIISEDLYSRTNLNENITKDVSQRLENFGIEVVSVETKRFDLPDDNERAVFHRMISERDQMAESERADGRYEDAKIRNETDKEVDIILSTAKVEAQERIGEGESEYMRILAEAYGTPDRLEFYEFLRTIEATKKALSGGNKTIILPSDAPIIASLFK